MRKKLTFLFLLLLSSVVFLPLLIMMSSSFMGTSEIIKHYGAVLIGTGGSVQFSLIPEFPTLKAYLELLFDSPGFYVMFWNSCRQVFGILFGECLVSIPAAWAFGRFEFPGRKALFTLYMVLMIMPFQVTMVSNYLVLDKLAMMDTHWAIIMPGIFSTFPVFIMTKFFRSIPRSFIEAAKIDGAGEISIFLKIGLPLGLPGILSAMILGFLEYWNAMEQPLAFLKTKTLWPMSLYLPNITTEQLSVAFTASIVMMAPALMLFLWGQSYLEQGIEASGLKE
ncbi:carbohydrate ABC transporter permease [Diplocloster agilis]|uniref:Carbohydrate ABC transporter permease n=1 Tax=Diplocloster agilis TaxID=2850323 RepID=A0A949K2T8_9FIRM|nr:MULTISPECIES: carbohydrate ABC transporter permease [Lachnospiraceae]MBU9738282.1 carbohydrate ABC transporter permease [Diplocloster agilis]MCU6735642.1 carbohydrate ABC transporter permease [Suonthocola fibrivorans]SCJ78575.1 Inner membrane ABC transporter permease protein ycjP [uncultured Clostridium sp.]